MGGRGSIQIKAAAAPEMKLAMITSIMPVKESRKPKKRIFSGRDHENVFFAETCGLRRL